MIPQQKAGDDGSVLYDKMMKDEVSVFCYDFNKLRTITLDCLQLRSLLSSKEVVWFSSSLRRW